MLHKAHIHSVIVHFFQVIHPSSSKTPWMKFLTPHGIVEDNDLWRGKRVCARALETMTISHMAIDRLTQEFEWSLMDGQAEDVDIVSLTSRKLQPMLAMLNPKSRLVE